MRTFKVSLADVIKNVYDLSELFKRLETLEQK